MSPPSHRFTLLIAVVRALALPVRSVNNLNAGAGSPKSQYAATANCASGCTAFTWDTIELKLAFTLASSPPMLPVLSTRSTMSGFGGMGGVDTVLVRWITSPGSAAWFTFGATPSAKAVPPDATSAAADTAAAMV